MAKLDENYKKLEVMYNLNVYVEGGSWVCRRGRDTNYGAGNSYGEAISDLIAKLAKDAETFLWMVENPAKKTTAKQG